MSVNRFLCPNCGSDRGFLYTFTTEAWSEVDYIDADTGHIVWAGISDSDYTTIENRGYECSACDHKFTKDAFDPKARIAQAMADLDAMFEDDDDDEDGTTPREVPTIEAEFLAALLKGERDG